MPVERIPISDRAQWLGLRGRDVTASVAGCLIGEHPYITPYELYLLKAGKITEDPEETPAMKRGRLLEPVAVQLLREERPSWQLEPYPIGFYYREQLQHLRGIGATPDLIALDEFGSRTIVQIKNVEPSVFRRSWQNERKEIVPPDWIMVQANIEAYLTGAHRAVITPLVVGFGLEMPIIEIPLVPGIIQRLQQEVITFWNRVEHAEPYPVNYSRDGDVIRSLYPEAEDIIVDLSDDNNLPVIAAEDKDLAAEIKTRETRRKEIKTEFLAKIGTAAGCIFQGGSVSANTVHRKAYSVEATSYRECRIKLAKGTERT